MTPQEMIDVIQAFQDGKQIEYKYHHAISITDWAEADSLCWNFKDRDYRIKPKQTKELYQFLLYNRQTKDYFSSDRFYENETEIKKQLYSCIEVIKRLDYTKITIEE